MVAQKSSSAKSPAKTLLILLVCFAVFVALSTRLDFSAISDTFSGLGYKPSDDISRLIEKDSFTHTGLRILKASRPELLSAADFNTKCYSGAERETSVLGCYGKTIYIYDIQNQDLDGIKETVLAHELLHAVWHRMSISERRALYEDMDKVYEANRSELGEHMSGYSDEEHYDELHSVIGTQITNDKLTPSLREHYAKYFEDQPKIVSYFEKYNGKFKELEEYLAELETKINQNRDEISAKTAEYESEAADLKRNIESFNARAASGSFADSASFYAERNELVSRQNALKDDLNSLNELISDTNELISDYNNNVIEVGKLYDSLNSRVEKPTGSIED